MPHPTFAVAVLALSALLLGACAGSDEGRSVGTTTTVPDDALTAELAVGPNVTVPPTLPVPDDFVAPDTRNVRIQPILSKPKNIPDHSKPILAMEGGTAKLHGRVYAPDGDVEGAVVRLERFVGEDFGVLDVPVKKDGTWEAVDILGGRYRVRAFKRPSMATTEPQPFFLAADKGEGNVDVTMDRHEGVQLQGALDAAEPHLGERITFRALVSQEEVDEDGIVRGKGLGGHTVAIDVLGGVRIIGDATAVTGDDGFALFTFMCTAEGVNAVNLRDGDTATSVELPNCSAGGIDAERLDPMTIPPFPVGQKFTTPFEGPLPPGTYRATTPGSCGTTYQAYVDGLWEDHGSIDRAIVAADPIRKIGPLLDSPPCTYERSA